MSSEQVGIEVKYEGPITVFIVRGEITLLDAPELKKSVEEAIRKGARKLLFDFENLAFIDSSGIGLLFRFHSQLKKENGKIAYINLHKNLENTMQKAMPQMIKDTSFFHSKEAALIYLLA